MLRRNFICEETDEPCVNGKCTIKHCVLRELNEMEIKARAMRNIFDAHLELLRELKNIKRDNPSLYRSMEKYISILEDNQIYRTGELSRERMIVLNIVSGNIKRMLNAQIMKNSAKLLS